jgi:dsDNA-specific endonuclease/ATPase MutS2
MLTVHRNFFFDHISVLKNIAEVADKLSKISKKIDSPLCWPEIIADESTHIVSFESIVPIHLLRHLPKEKKPIPIESMPTLNGQIIGLTGDHEGGKTTTMLAYAELIYLAQSGLPVFGKGVELNLKSHLGLVFLTKEEGPSSTARTLIDKMVKVIKDSKEVDPKKVVLIFDELGEGTQESSGDKLGRDLLTRLGNSGISIIFNTQITSLAEYAQDKLGAQCMKFSVDHRIYPGIGSGNMDDLRERSGLNAELAQIAITA